MHTYVYPITQPAKIIAGYDQDTPYVPQPQMASVTFKLSKGLLHWSIESWDTSEGSMSGSIPYSGDKEYLDIKGYELAEFIYKTYWEFADRHFTIEKIAYKKPQEDSEYIW